MYDPCTSVLKSERNIKQIAHGFHHRFTVLGLDVEHKETAAARSEQLTAERTGCDAL